LPPGADVLIATGFYFCERLQRYAQVRRNIIDPNSIADDYALWGFISSQRIHRISFFFNRQLSIQLQYREWKIREGAEQPAYPLYVATHWAETSGHVVVMANKQAQETLEPAFPHLDGFVLVQLPEETLDVASVHSRLKSVEGLQMLYYLSKPSELARLKSLPYFDSTRV
jgi:hypothetical protein